MTYKEGTHLVIKAHYERNGIQLICGDCLDILPELDDDSIDAIITDPPYMCTDLKFDKKGIPSDWHKAALNPVKDDGYLAVFDSPENFYHYNQLWTRRFYGAWVKKSGVMVTHSAKMPMGQIEQYGVFAHPDHKIKNLTWNKVYKKGKPYKRVYGKSNGYKRDGKDQLSRISTGAWSKEGYIKEANNRQETTALFAGAKIHMKHNERTPHPTQKPLSIMSVIIQWITNENDLILDPFVGSGTTLIAAAKLGRKAIGIEKEPEYFDIACRRVDAEFDKIESELPL